MALPSLIDLALLRRRLRDRWRRLSPAQLFVLSFAGVIALGTVGFQVIPGLYAGPPLDWLDSLFTATSAVCVTGLIVQDTATWFTPLGQAYVLVLIQLGGLGVITFATWIMVALGQRISVRQESLSLDPDSPTTVDPRGLVRDVIRFTVIMELSGAVLLWALFVPRFGFGAAAWHAVFHAVSAFCNAGFSTLSDSLVSFRTHPAVLGVIMTLIVVGGLGFLAMSELQRVARDRPGSLFASVSGRRPGQLTVHTRLVLASTAILVVSGWMLFAVLEWNGVLAVLGPFDRLANSLFMSVTARTAGFNTVDYELVSDGANFLTILLMAIGGSPGSTAGGLKTTTIALLVLLAVARLRGRENVTIASRTVPHATVQRAVGLAVLVFAVLTLAVFLLSTVETDIIAHAGPSGRFLAVMFEAASALNTVGLTMGVTDELSTLGRWVTVLLMFVGRVGPLTFVAALSRPARAGREIRMAHQDVLIG